MASINRAPNKEDHHDPILSINDAEPMDSIKAEPGLVLDKLKGEDEEDANENQLTEVNAGEEGTGASPTKTLNPDSDLQQKT